MKVVLLRVGIDTGSRSGGILGPLYADGSFEFIPITDGWRVDARTYGNTVGKHGRPFADYFPASQRNRMSQHPMHVDPEFETFTYGDPTSPKASLRNLTRGDLLVFYAGLEGCDCDAPPALYIVGYFEVEIAGRASDLGEDLVEAEFRRNFHVMNRNVHNAQRDRLVLVKGSPSSRLLGRAVKISEDAQDSRGRHIYVVSAEMRETFSTFRGKGSITRSNPRWIEPPFADRAAKFVRSLP